LPVWTVVTSKLAVIGSRHGVGRRGMRRDLAVSEKRKPELI
jgi:hypothetical protein